MAGRRPVLVKLLVGAAALAVLAVLFLRTLRETASAPYGMQPEHLTGWELVLDPAARPDGPLLLLRPPRELTMGLFQQVFERTMESMNAPASYGVTLILRREYERALAPLIGPDELLALARDASLDATALAPRCLAVQPGRTTAEPRRTFFVLFDLPALRAFRDRVGRLLAERGGAATAFDPAALAPALYLAATDGGFRGWPAAGAGAEQHCVAPVELRGSD